MTLSGITFKGPLEYDQDLLEMLPEELAALLRSVNGFILYHGALHFRGASFALPWHDLRRAWHGDLGLHQLYDAVEQSDVPFAQDIFGDQFIWRNGMILRLWAETGEMEVVADSLDEFFHGVEDDIEDYLNVNTKVTVEPGQLISAYPPFCTKESAGGCSFRACPADEVITFHAEFARKIRCLTDGERLQIRTSDDE